MKKVKITFAVFCLVSILIGAFLGAFYTLSKLNPTQAALSSVNSLVRKLPKPYVIYSGSMEPTIKTASVVFSVPQENYYSGDIVTFQAGGSSRPEAFSPNNDLDNLVTHRIEFKNYPRGIHENPVYLTSGDANGDMDKWEITDEQIVGRVAFSVPYLGYAVDFAKKPYGFILLVIVPATIIIYEELQYLKKEIGKIVLKLKRKKNKSDTSTETAKLSGAGVSKISILLPAIGALIILISASAGFFADRELIAENLLGVSESYGEQPEPTPIPENTHTIYLNELGGDIADQYGYNHDYSTAAGNNVSFTYVSPANPRLSGTINATHLKPFATYQVKFEGIPTCVDPANGNDLANEYVGYNGRWTCPDCAGDANARNRTDAQYEANELLADTDPDKECIVGYLVWDFFTADGSGNASKFVETTNSYHVLWCGGGTCDTVNNDYLSTLDPLNPAVQFCPADKVDGEIERYTCGGLNLDSGSYHLNMSLTEESFHQGSWATVLMGEIDFDLLPNHLVINEVYYDVDSAHGNETDNEWIEIYNPTSSAVDISGWSIADNNSTDTIPTSPLIPAKGYAVIANDSSTWPYWSIPPDVVKINLNNMLGNGLGNDGDRLSLNKTLTETVDEISWGDNTDIFDPSLPDVGEGHSLEREPDGVDTNTINDFIDKDVPTPGN